MGGHHLRQAALVQIQINEIILLLTQTPGYMPGILLLLALYLVFVYREEEAEGSGGRIFANNNPGAAMAAYAAGCRLVAGFQRGIGQQYRGRLGTCQSFAALPLCTHQLIVGPYGTAQFGA